MTSARGAVQRRALWFAGAIFALAWLAYGLALAGDYVFDDLHSVRGNPAVHDLGNLGRFWTDPSAFSSGLGRMYRPVLLTSLSLNYAFDPAPWSLKAGNVLLHAAVAALAFAWFWRLSRRLGASAAVAALFAVHPLASEAVNLVSARSELLAALGMLMALHAHLGWERNRGRAWAAAGMVAGAVVACGSKETGVVLPALAAAQAYWLRRDHAFAARWRRSFGGLLPLVAVAVLYLLARRLLLGEATVQLLGRAGGDPLSGHGRTLAVQFATMGTLLPGCVAQALVPWRLSLDPVVVFRSSFADPAVLAGWATMLALTLLAARPGAGARLRRLGVALAWITALPWIVVPLNMPLAEHRLYGSLLGAGAVVVGLAPMARRLLSGPARAFACRALLPAALLAGVVGSGQRSWVYRDERELWRVELARHPESFRAWWGLGTATLRAGDAAGAVEPLATAHALYPGHFDVLRNYVEALVAVPDDSADPERTLEVAARLVRTSPNDPWARTLHAEAHLLAGRRGRGAEHFEAAERLALSCLQIATPKGYVYRLAAAARRGLGDLPGALAHLDASIARGLATIEVRLDRAAVLEQLGRRRQAHAELMAVQRIAPTDPRVVQALRQWAAAPPK